MVVRDGNRREVGIVDVDAAYLFDGGSVEVNDACFDLQDVPGQGDNSLHPGLPTIRGVEEGDEVVVLGLAVAIAVFADENFGTFIEGWAH